MLENRSARFLRNVLWIDAATCVACGLFMVVTARPFGQLAHLPPALPATWAGAQRASGSC